MLIIVRNFVSNVGLYLVPVGVTYIQEDMPALYVGIATVVHGIPAHLWHDQTFNPLHSIPN